MRSVTATVLAVIALLTFTAAAPADGCACGGGHGGDQCIQVWVGPDGHAPYSHYDPHCWNSSDGWHWHAP